MTNSELLSIVMDDARKYSLFYLNKLIEAKVDFNKIFEIDGKKLNNVNFILGHLAVTENYLCLRCTGGDIVRFDWAKLFALGAPIPTADQIPSFDNMMETMKAVHEKSINHIKNLSDADLNLDNPGNFKLGSDLSNRSVIIHAIRHEGSHAGHLGWLCKLHGIKTI